MPRVVTPAPLLEATCRCGGIWKTGAQTNLDWLDPQPPILPLWAMTPCPKCRQRNQVVQVRRL